MSMERSGGDEDSDNMEFCKIEYIWIELVVILDVGFSRYIMTTTCFRVPTVCVKGICDPPHITNSLSTWTRPELARFKGGPVAKFHLSTITPVADSQLWPVHKLLGMLVSFHCIIPTCVYVMQVTTVGVTREFFTFSLLTMVTFTVLLDLFIFCCSVHAYQSFGKGICQKGV